jgi:N-methylhydantoinase A
MRVGVEVGGTFTDVIAVGDDGTVAHTDKVFSTPRDPAEGVLEGLRRIPHVGKGTTLVHGSTIGTNAVLERKGARTGLLVTAGFRDVLELQRQDRTTIYDIHYQKPVPLVPRDLVREVPERLDASGGVITPLDEAAALEAARALVEDAGVTAIAVCFLHAYRNPAHERRVGDLIRARHPAVSVSLSSDVIAEFREYERCSTTVTDAFIKPVIDRYLRHLERELPGLGFEALWVMESNGGVLPSGYAREHPARTLMSGPAAGVTGATSIALQAGIPDLITLDMGGTSTDVCLVNGGEPLVSGDAALDNIPLKVPMIDLVSVGAGGGSLVWIDSGGMLQVGPQSAGAEPGPACYGRGGDGATATDANVVRGLLRPHRFLGGRMLLDRDAARRALMTIAAKLGVTPERLAEDVFRVASTTMANAIRLVSVERGYDPRDYTLVAYGGAGPLHAAAVAEDLDVSRVLVPPYPGLLSAFGLLVADFRRDFARTDVQAISQLTTDRVVEGFQSLARAALDEVAAGGLDRARAQVIGGLDMRYRGQGFELTVPVSVEQVAADGMEGLAKRFHRLHEQRYGHSAPREEVQVVTYRVTVVVPQPKPARVRVCPTGAKPPDTVPLLWQDRPVPCAFWWRAALETGQEISGPAVIEEDTATTFVPPGWTMRSDDVGNLRLERRARP